MTATQGKPMEEASPQPAPVYLVGAGPGDAGLITVKGRSLVQSADILIYDYLANPTFLSWARPDAELVFVGKKGFSEHVTQDQINACIVAAAQAHPEARIVRLKGGDPFVFGRGGEEALALTEAGIPFEVVPGVTAGAAAPAYAGIPVTHRGMASSVALVTGHETPDKPETAIDWDHLARGIDTLCFYMGIRSLPLIVERLTAAGRAADTPVALVRWGSTPRQETLVSTLDQVVDEVKRRDFQAPAIIVVGEVVRLRERLSWFEDRPLFGKRIVVTRARAQASDLVARLAADGADVFEFPVIRIKANPVDETYQDAIAQLSSFNWVVFTSANGVSCFFDAMESQGRDARAFGSARIAAIGSATAAELADRGIIADAVPDEYVAEAVADVLVESGIDGARILLARAEMARNVLPERLQEAGAQVQVLPVYKTVADGAAQAADLVDRLREGQVDAITFTSSSTVRNLIDVVARACPGGREEALGLLAGTALESIGPITSKTLRAQGLDPAAQADTYTIDGLIALLREELQS